MARRPTMSRRLRRLRMGLATLFGHKPQGFFIPYRRAAEMLRPNYDALEARLHGCEAQFRKVLADADGLAGDLLRIGADAPPEPRWKQDWFPPLDALAAYTMLRTLKPAQVVEIGSGHSTRFLARAVRDGGLATQITAIDPQPRADLSQLDVKFVRSTAQQAGPERFAELEAGDFLMVDSSHVLVPGSDVDLVLNVLVPALPSGVVLQFHDIFLPDDYPLEWRWRGYNEQQGLGPLVADWEVLFAGHYVATRMKDAVAESVAGRLDAPASPYESCLWLRKP
jgi:hypothetical protein